MKRRHNGGWGQSIKQQLPCEQCNRAFGFYCLKKFILDKEVDCLILAYAVCICSTALPLWYENQIWLVKEDTVQIMTFYSMNLVVFSSASQL